MLIGYARVSTNEQDTTAQSSALKTAGCGRIFREKATEGRWNRPELQRLLDHLRKGDVLVVWKLDRLSRPRPTHSSKPALATRPRGSGNDCTAPRPLRRSTPLWNSGRGPARSSFHADRRDSRSSRPVRWLDLQQSTAENVTKHFSLQVGPSMRRCGCTPASGRHS
jgi:hypothetical protein